MPGDKDDLLAGDLVRRRDGLLGIAGIVGDLEHELVAEHPAFGVDVGDRHLGTALHLLAKDRIRAGDRPDNGDFDVGRPRRAGASGDCRSKNDQPGQPLHETPLPRFSIDAGKSTMAARERERGFRAHSRPPSR